ADYFPRARRGRVFSVFFAAIPIGSALGFIVGGYANAHFGWRAAFFIAGLPGLALAALAMRLPDPPRGPQEGGEDLHGGPAPRGAFRLARADAPLAPAVPRRDRARRAPALRLDRPRQLRHRERGGALESRGGRRALDPLDPPARRRPLARCHRRRLRRAAAR